MRIRRVLILATCVMLAATLTWGQGIVTGSMSGTVVDPHKAVVANAKVTAVHVATNREVATTTNEVGLFTLPLLPIGTYNVTITAPGFQKLEIRALEVLSGRDLGLGTRTLTLGKTSEVVNVEGTAPLVETTTVQNTKSFDPKAINNFANTGGLDSMALFTPGVAPAGSIGAGNTNGASISANGQRTRANNFQVDGQNNNDSSVTGPAMFMGNPDAIGEFQVVTNYTAEYGRNMGAVVNYITKSGTNSFHGTAFENHVNSAFYSMRNDEKSSVLGFCMPYKHADGTARATKWPTATEVANKTNDCTTPVVAKDIDNRFGGTVGGPIKKDKAWFFGSYMEERERWAGSPSVSSPAVTPTPSGLATLAAIAPTSPGVSALTKLSPFAVSAGDPIVIPGSTYNVTVNGTPVEVGQVSRNVPGYYNDREFIGKVDYQLTQKDRLSGRYTYQKQQDIGVYAGLGFSNGDWDTLIPFGEQVAADWVRTWTDRLTNQVRVSYTRQNLAWNDANVPGCTIVSFLDCKPEIDFRTSRLMSLGTYSGFPQGRINNYYTLQDNGTWIRGKHTLKFGGEFDIQRNPSVFLPNYNGTWVFGTCTSSSVACIGTDLQTLVANTPYRLSMVDGQQKMYFNTHDQAAYFQDDWRIKSNLTLQLGIRWEMFAQATNNLHDMTVKRQLSAHPFWDPNLPLSRTTVRYVDPAIKNFSPVLGFAWNPEHKLLFIGNGKSTIRGGFRISYDPAFYNIFTNVYGGAPVVNANTFSSGTIPPLPNTTTWASSVIHPYTVSFAPSGAGQDPGYRTQADIAPNFHNPYSQQWRIGLQQMVGSRSAFELSYVGSHTIGLYQTINGNPGLAPFIPTYQRFIPVGLKPCADATMPGYAGGYVDCTRTLVNERGNFGVARYDALQSRLDISNWHHLTFNFGYTYSRNLDDSSETYDYTAVGELSVNPDPFSPHTVHDWGTSGISFPHVATVVMSYDLPFYTKQQGILGKALGGWTLNTSYRYTSGAPWTPYQPKATSLCDPWNLRNSTWDTCRPILANANAPINTVGYMVKNTSTGVTSVYDWNYYNTNGVLPTTPGDMSQFHWLINSSAAINAFNQAPWNLSTPRNLQRGDTINNANLGVYKNTKLNERFALQFQMHVFNFLNRSYMGTPNAYIGNLYTNANGSPASFANTYYRSGGYGQAASLENGVGRRAIQFVAKITF